MRRRSGFTISSVFALLLAAGGASVVMGGCNLEPGVAGKPTYEADVKPILESRCIRCHGYPQLQGATPGVRFDLYQCPTADGGSVDGSAPVCSFGAKDVAVLMSQRVHLAKDAVPHMPPSPAAPLSDYQVDTITKWAAETPPLEQ